MIPDQVEIVCCAFGERYKDLYPRRLYSMLKRHMPVPFRLTIVTDRKRNLPREATLIDASGWKMRREGMRPTTNKLRLFDPDIGLPKEFLYMDTTLVIQKDMGPLLEYAFGWPGELVIVKDWNYDCYNSCVMRIKSGGKLRAIYDAFVAGEVYPYHVNGDQDYVHAVVKDRGFEDEVAIFSPDQIVSYRNARDLSETDPDAAYAYLAKGIIVKFFGYVKMHKVSSPFWQFRKGLKDPKLRPVLRFWTKELREKWR